MRKKKKSVYVNVETRTMLLLSGYSIEPYGMAFRVTVPLFYLVDNKWVKQPKPSTWDLGVSTKQAAWACLYRHWTYNERKVNNCS